MSDDAEKKPEAEPEAEEDEEEDLVKLQAEIKRLVHYLHHRAPSLTTRPFISHDQTNFILSLTNI
jgi:hypothetical protein